jgi:periodic tryptophan protein 2
LTAANNAASKYFNSITYTADGSCVIAGGSSKYVCIYSRLEGVLVKKFQISENLSLDGTQEFLDSRKMTQAGAGMEDIDDESDIEDRLDTTLPGAQRGDMSKRRVRREAKTMCVRFSQTGRSWAAASTEGLLIYSLDESTTFDPFDLSLDLTPESILQTLAAKDYLVALIMALRLSELPLIKKVYAAVPPADIKLLARQIPPIYVQKLLAFIADQLEKSPHVEFDLLWVGSMLTSHGKWLRDRRGEMASVFRGLQKGLMGFEASITKLYVIQDPAKRMALIPRCDDNAFSLDYIISQSQRPSTSEETIPLPPLPVS